MSAAGLGTVRQHWTGITHCPRVVDERDAFAKQFGVELNVHGKLGPLGDTAERR